MSDNVMYDSPTEFMRDAASGEGECVAQSVIPDDHGGYLCACSCGEWHVTAPSREEGLRLAKLHTGSPV